MALKAPHKMWVFIASVYALILFLILSGHADSSDMLISMFLGGGFLGSGASSSKTNQTTNIETTQVTEIGDVGLTGANAVNLAGVIQAGATDREAIRSNLVQSIVQEQGANFRQLVGGASNLVSTQRDVLDTARNTASSIIGAATNTASTTLNRASGEDSDWVKIAPYAFVAIGLVAIPLFLKLSKG